MDEALLRHGRLHRILYAALTFAVILSGSSNAGAESPAEIKRNVVVVLPRFHDATRETFADLSDFARRQAEQLRSRAQSDPRYAKSETQDFVRQLDALALTYASYAQSSGHGSGWLWRPRRDDESAYIVTNRDVAGQARDVVIEFRRPTVKEVTGEVIYVSSTVDLAVIKIAAAEIPKGATGLELFGQSLSEGDPIFASGYPGTTTAKGRRASYSLTNGIVSNADFDTGLSDGLTLEHSATIDRGNSGGPLLMRTRSRSFRVVGINTAYNSSRRNSNLAIPAALVADELAAALEAQKVATDPPRMESELRATAEKLAVELGSARPDLKLLRGLIAYAYVGDSPDSLVAPVESWLDGKMDDATFAIYLLRPVEIARYVLLLDLHEAWGSHAGSVGEVRLARVIDRDEVGEGGPVRTIFEMHGKKREISWVWEQGSWRIAHAALPRSSSYKRSVNEDATELRERSRTADRNDTFEDDTLEYDDFDQSYSTFRQLDLWYGVHLGLGRGRFSFEAFLLDVEDQGDTTFSFGGEAGISFFENLSVAGELSYVRLFEDILRTAVVLQPEAAVVDEPVFVRGIGRLGGTFDLGAGNIRSAFLAVIGLGAEVRLEPNDPYVLMLRVDHERVLAQLSDPEVSAWRLVAGVRFR
ncbi:MAG: serine protease [Myxococcota bacterium]